MNERNEIISKITEFINEIGIETEERALEDNTFLPGIKIELGKLIFDPEKLKHPGDLLHEAGHIALTEKETRNSISGDVVDPDPNNELGTEIGVILWTVAASEAIGLPLEVVFHPEGYRGASSWYIESFQNKSYIGLPLLVWMGMTHDPNMNDPEKKPFPHMMQWLRP